MVFCGRPSKACQQCRNRRLRCDLRRETCSQCERAKLVCSGYRDVEQLRIRDQSQATIKRALNKQECRKVQALPRSVLPSLEQRAKAAFFSRYVVGNLKTYDYVRSFYGSPSMDDHLSASIDAVSLAYFSHQNSSSTVLKQAREKYIYALRLTNAALCSSDLVIKDATLLSTLLLDLFEKFTAEKPRSRGPWTSHVNGALALVRMRGVEQFSTPIGFRMVVRLNTNILISFVACDMAIPQEFLAIRRYAARFLNTVDPKWRLTDLMVHYAAFRADLQAGKLSNSEIVDSALRLDANYLDLTLTMPPSWSYETIHLACAAPGAFMDYCHVYPDQHITQTWNVIRIIRILLNDTIRKCCFSLNESTNTMSTSNVFNAVTNSIQTLAVEICASGHQYFGDLEISPADQNTSGTSLSARMTKTTILNPHYDSSLTYLQCYTLLFPFYIAARYAQGSLVKDWVIQQLHYMSNRFHFKQAHLVAEVLENCEDISPWLVYVMLGSYAFAA